VIDKLIDFTWSRQGVSVPMSGHRALCGSRTYDEVRDQKESAEGGTFLMIERLELLSEDS
jgi:hypothetical protein